MEDCEAFTRRFFYDDPDIKTFKTMVVMDRVKAGFALPLHVDREAARRGGRHRRSPMLEAAAATIAFAFPG